MPARKNADILPQLGCGRVRVGRRGASNGYERHGGGAVEFNVDVAPLREG